jgi:hypothetical protein
MKKRSLKMACFSWTIDGFKIRASEILQSKDSKPMTSGDFEFDGMRWRMVLFIESIKCNLYLQLKTAVNPVRAAIR